MNTPATTEPIDTIDNPSGLSDVRYAHGRYAELRKAVLDVIARDRHYLRELNSRDPADPTTALVDSWAVAGEVLSFYAERIANESWLSTATERRSLRSLARLLDYELRPGKAAETWLAFTLESAEGAPLEVPIPAGTRVQSVPGPGEEMVTFETITDIVGRPHLSAMRPRLSRTQELIDIATTQSAICQGALNDIRRGDTLLLASTSNQLMRVERVVTSAPANTTHLELNAEPVVHEVRLPPVAAYLPLNTLIGRALAPALIAQVVTNKRRNQITIEAELTEARIDRYQLSRHLWRSRTKPAVSPPGEGLFHFRRRAAIFGHNEPNTVSNGEVVASAPPTIRAGSDVVALDAEYSEVRPGGWVAFTSTSGEPFVTLVVKVDTLTERRGLLTGRVTRLTLQDTFPEAWSGRSVAEIAVHVDSRALALAPLAVTQAVQGTELRLDRYLPGLAEGQTIVVTGELADLPGVFESEVHAIAAVELDDGFTLLRLASAIVGAFERSSVRVNGNVALATHGESGGQAIGHGDASVPGQRFRLPVVPVTHVGAPNAKGLAACLEVRVDGIRWSEVESLRDAKPEDRVYQLRYAEDGSVWLSFGDGVKGRRLTTGLNNVVASWRKGAGPAGMVKAGQLTLLSGAPLGVKGVINPLPASGAAGGETLEEARENAPLSVLTSGRIVTLRDYADFARAFAGIAKAHATWSWNGQARSIALTVAGVAGEVPAQRDIDNLRGAIRKASDGSVTLSILPYRPATFRVNAAIRVQDSHVPEVVLTAAEAALRYAFSFGQRQLGQPVYRSDVITILQQVPGVDWLDLNYFYRGEVADLATTLYAETPRSGLRLGLGSEPIAAELLTLHPGTLKLRAVT